MGRVNAKPTLKHQTVMGRNTKLLKGRPTDRSAFLLLPSTLPHNPLIENGKERTDLDAESCDNISDDKIVEVVKSKKVKSEFECNC